MAKIVVSESKALKRPQQYYSFKQHIGKWS